MATATVHGHWQHALEQALFAGIEAAETKEVIPMVVGTPVNMLGSLMGGPDGGFREDRPTYFVEGGVCGFAWVQFRGNRKFLNYLLGRVKTKHPASAALGTLDGIVSDPRPDTYNGGVSMSVFGYGQSMQRKEAFARAFARRLREELGLSDLDVYAQSRMD